MTALRTARTPAQEARYVRLVASAATLFATKNVLWFLALDFGVYHTAQNEEEVASSHEAHTSKVFRKNGTANLSIKVGFQKDAAQRLVVLAVHDVGRCKIFIASERWLNVIAC